MRNYKESMVTPIRRVVISTALAVFAGTASATDLPALYGRWGTHAQCTGLPVKPGGTVMATPFEIRPDWLQHGQIWCSLTWFPAQMRGDGLFVTAGVLCCAVRIVPRATGWLFCWKTHRLTLR